MLANASDPFLSQGQVLEERAFGPVINRVKEIESNIGSIISRENTIASLRENFVESLTSYTQPIDPEFDPFKYVGDYDPKYFVRANSLSEVESIKRRLDKEASWNEQFVKMPTADKLVGLLMAGVLDPTTFLPFGSVSKGAGLLKNFSKVASGSAAVMAAQEGLLQSSQLTRSTEESIANVAAGAILGGAIGGYLGRVPAAQKIAMRDAIKSHLNSELFPKSSSVGAVEVPQGVGSELASSLGLESITKWISPVTRLAGLKSPKANLFFENLLEQVGIRTKNLEGIASDTAAETLIKMSQGDQLYVAKALDNSYAEYRAAIKGTRESRISFSQFKNEVYDAMYSGDVSRIPQAEKLAKDFRSSIIEPWHEKLIGSDLLDESQKVISDLSYVPRAYNIQKILADPEGFKDALVAGFQDSLRRSLNKVDDLEKLVAQGNKDAIEELEKIRYRSNMDANELRQAASDTMNTITGLTGDAMFSFVKSGMPKSTKHRMDVSSSFLKEYLNRDVEDVLHRYIKEASASTTIVKKFGDLNATKWKHAINDEYSRLTVAANKEGNTKLAKALTKERVQTLHDFDYYLKAVSGQPLGSKSNEGMRRAGKFLRGVNTLSMLSNVIMSSLAEPIRIITVNGMFKTMKELPLAVRAIRDVINKAPPRELQKIAAGTEGVINSRIAEFMNVGHEFGRMSKAERFMDVAQKKFFNLTGLNQWTDAEKIWSGTLYTKRMVEAGEKLSKGSKLNHKEIVEFASYGLDQDDLRAIFKQYSEFGDLKNHDVYLGTDFWADKELANKTLASLKKVVDSMVVTRKQGNVPKVLENNEFGRLAAQFLSYGLAATSDVTMQAAQRMAMGDIRGVNALTFMTMVGTLQFMAKEKLAHRPLTEDPMELLYAGFDQGGAAGVFPNILGRMDSATGNAISNKLGLRNTKYRMMDPFSAVMGPSANLGKGAATIVRDIVEGDINSGTVHAARKLLPLQNWIVLRDAFNELEDIVVDKTGIPKKKRPIDAGR